MEKKTNSNWNFAKRILEKMYAITFIVNNDLEILNTQTDLKTNIYYQY